MTFCENISLEEYADSANQIFSESENRISQIEGSFQTRMNGKTIGGLVGAMFGTICWLVTFCAFFWYTRGYVNSRLSLVCFGVALTLIATLLIDEIIGFSYYRKISTYKNNITQLKNRVSVGRSSIKSNQDTFIKSRANGWSHPLSVGTSISEEVSSIESTINGMESLKDGFIQSLNNFLYFTFVIVFTGIGSWTLFGTTSEILTSMSGEYMGSMVALDVINLIVAEVGMVILAKMWWSYTDCSVTNTTILVSLLGPFLFLTLTIAVSCLIMMVIWIVGIVISIVIIGGAIGLLTASISGG